MTPRELHKQAMKLRIEAGKLDAEAIRAKERNRIIALLSEKMDDLKPIEAWQAGLYDGLSYAIEIIIEETNE
jgi:hypothetical protein